MATVSPVASVPGGGVVLADTAAASGGDVVPNDRNNVFILVKNGHASATRTVTVAAQTTHRGASDGFPAMTLSNAQVTVAAQGQQIIGPFPNAFNNGSGQLALTYSDSGADITIAPFTMP